MVTVVINDCDTVDFANFGKAAIDAPEGGQSIANFTGLHSQMPRHCDSRQGVRNVVVTRHGQGTALDHHIFGLQRDIELCHAANVVQVQRPHVSLRVKSVGHDAAVGDLAHKALHVGIVGAAHGHPVKRNVGHKIKEPLMQRRLGAPMFHVFGVNVGHDRDCRRQAVEGAVAFICLDDHPFALPHARVGPVGVDDATVHNGRVKIAGNHQLRHHRGGGGFAMRARNCDVGFQAHQLGQHFCAAHNRQAARTGGVQFRIAGFDGRRNHHDLGVRNIFGALTLKDQAAQFVQTVGDF